MKERLLILGSIMILTLNACGQGNIAKRWQAAGRLTNGKIIPHKTKTQEYEFLNNGTFNIYVNGSISENGTYVLASDKKSVLLKDGNRGQSIPIVKLTATELNIIPSKGDTIVCYVSGSASSTKTQNKAVAYKQTLKDWYAMYRDYLMRGDLMANIIYSINSTKNDGDKKFTSLLDLKKEASTFASDMDKLTKQDIEKYIRVQDKISTGLPDLLTYVKDNMPTRYDEINSQFSNLEKKLKTSKDNFTKSYGEYTQ